MARYFPEPVPYTDDLPYIREWLGREFSNILAAFEEVELVQLQEDHIEPTPRDGMIKWADGTNWNPNGLGEGLYWYANARWNKLIFTGDSSNGGIELGQTDGTTSTPFIDFHSGATVVDYDSRIIASGGSGVSGGGTLEFRTADAYFSSGRIRFPTAQNASADANTLDDYEEGTWTPQWKGSGTAGTFTYSHQQGAYIKIGQLIYWMCGLRVTAITVAPTGNLAVIGLPFTPSYSPFSWSGFGHVSYTDIAQAGITSWGIIFDGNFPIAATDQLRISGQTAGGPLNTQLLAASLAVNNFFIASGVYRATN